jgi:hypothetical protein
VGFSWSSDPGLLDDHKCIFLVSIKRTFVYSIGLIILTLTHPNAMPLDFSLLGIIAFDLGRENGNCGESSEDGVDHLSPMLCAPHYSLESRCD